MIEVLEGRIAPALVLIDALNFSAESDVPDLVKTDASGNVIVAGRFKGTVALTADVDGPQLNTSDPAGDIYVVKFSPDFQFIWGMKWGGTGAETALDLVIDAAGDVFVGGQFSSTNAGFSGGSTFLTASPASPQGFVFKASGTNGAAVTAFDSDGQLSYGNGTGNSSVNAMVFDSAGLVVGGRISGTGNGVNGSGSLDAVDTDGFAARIDGVSGAPDFAFGGSLGGVTLDFGSSTDSVFRLEVNSLNELFIGYRSVVTSNNLTIFSVSRYDSSDNLFVPTFGSGGTIPIATGDGEADFALDSTGRVISATTLSGGGVGIFRYNEVDGDIDTTFGPNAQGGNGGANVVPVSAVSVSLEIGADGFIYVAGETPTKNYVGRLTANGLTDTAFGQFGFAEFGAVPSTGTSVGFTFDPDGNLILRDSYIGNPDLDPGKSVAKLGTAARQDGDSYILRLSPNSAVASQPIVIPASGSMEVVITLTGPGRVEVLTAGQLGQGAIGSIKLFDTTLASNLTISVRNFIEGTVIGQILTMAENQHMGSIKVDQRLSLGFGGADTDPELLVTGRINTIVVGDLAQNTLISLGKDLPYNVAANTTTPDTYNNKPNFTARNVLGAGIEINVTGDGNPQGVGGGGLGAVIFQKWDQPGFIRTTQSIGSFLVKEGDFNGILEVDKFHVGAGTTANVGSMTVTNGNWGSSGTEVEGNIGVFDVDAFLAGAAITAGGITTVKTGAGEFNGTLTLTDTDAKGVATFTVATDFTGKVISASPLKKLVIKGDFRGSLQAPSIASITAFSFEGTTAGDGEGDPTKSNITTTAGLLGLLRSTSGTFKDYEITSPVHLSGIKVSLTKLSGDAIGLENVTVSAATIGPITVTLAGDAKTAGVDLTAIKNSSFTATGKMGPVKVVVTGATGATLGLSDATFTADSIASVLVTTSKSKAVGATSQAVNIAAFNANTTLGPVNILGDATMAQASKLDLWAGGKIGPVAVKSKTATFGTVEESTFLAGQSFAAAEIADTKELNKRLAAASMGPVNVGGSLIGSTIAAGGTVGVVNVGGSMSLTNVLAGALLGADRILGGGDDTFYRAGVITAVSVKGTFESSTLSAGVNAVDGVFGNGDDVAGTAIGSLPVVSAIKSLTVGTATVLPGAVAGPHNYAVQAGLIVKMTVAGQKLTDFSQPFLLDGGAAGESVEDVLVRIL